MLRTYEVAKILMISRGSVHNYIKAGKLHSKVANMPSGRFEYRFDRKEVDEIAKSHGG